MNTHRPIGTTDSHLNNFPPVDGLEIQHRQLDSKFETVSNILKIKSKKPKMTATVRKYAQLDL